MNYMKTSFYIFALCTMLIGNLPAQNCYLVKTQGANPFAGDDNCYNQISSVNGLIVQCHAEFNGDEEYCSATLQVTYSVGVNSGHSCSSGTWSLNISASAEVNKSNDSAQGGGQVTDPSNKINAHAWLEEADPSGEAYASDSASFPNLGCSSTIVITHYVTNAYAYWNNAPRTVDIHTQVSGATANFTQLNCP